MILGMPFFLRTEPHIKWKARAFVVQDGATTNILRAELLTAAEKELIEARAHVEWDAKKMVYEESSESEDSPGESENPSGGRKTLPSRGHVAVRPMRMDRCRHLRARPSC